VLSVILGFALGVPLILATGHDPISAYVYLFIGALGSIYSITETLVKAIPLVLAGLGMAIAFRCKVFNIGGEGQLYMGALGATFLALSFGGLNPIALFPLALAGGFLGGGMWAAIPGVLKARFKVNEVLTTMMMNFIAILFINYLVSSEGPMNDPLGRGFATSPPIPTSVRLPILYPMSRLHAGLIIAIFATFAVYFLLERTTLGFRIRAVGANPVAARGSGMSINRTIILSMLLSGGLAGLAGMVEVFGVNYRLVSSISVNYGYTAIMAALFGELNPWGIALSSLLFGVLIVGADTMARQTGVSVFIAYLLQGLIVVTAVALEHSERLSFKHLISWIKKGGKRAE
jgi:simple sugar transport system permease protein